MAMHKTLLLMPLLICASPAFAQQAPSQLPPVLTDPATLGQVTDTAQAVTDALLNVRVGEVRAAVEGRQATSTERRMTVGDLARRDDPDFDRHLHENIARGRARVQQSMRAVNEALPAVMQALTDAQRSIERAVANLPDPSYPRR
jgi:hypothetical protein